MLLIPFKKNKLDVMLKNGKKKSMLCKQKNRHMWLLNGDNNTNCFHVVVKKRRIVNHISQIQDSNGCWIDDYDQIDLLALDYFQNVFRVDNELSISDINQPL